MHVDTILEYLRTQEGLFNTLGLELDTREGKAVARMTVQPLHAGAPGIAHGGSIMSLLDTALGLQALMLALEVGGRTSTVEMKCNFLRPVVVGQTLVVRPEVQSRGKSLLVLSGAAEVEETGKRAAFAVGTFNVFGGEVTSTR